MRPDQELRLTLVKMLWAEGSHPSQVVEEAEELEEYIKGERKETCEQSARRIEKDATSLNELIQGASQ